MNWNKTIVSVALAAAAALSSAAALADGYRFHHGHHGHGAHFGLFIGTPIWGPTYYPYARSYGYYPPTRVIMMPAAPTVYVERIAPPVYVERDPYSALPGAPSSDWWYYCGSSRSYYPYVRECREGWQRVAPLPPSP